MTNPIFPMYKQKPGNMIYKPCATRCIPMCSAILLFPRNLSLPRLIGSSVAGNDPSTVLQMNEHIIERECIWAWPWFPVSQYPRPIPIFWQI